MDSKKISEYLDQIQWRYNVIDDSTVLTGYRCMVSFYDFQVPIEIRTSKYWVTVRSLLHRGIEPNRLPAIASFLSRLNGQCRSVRYFLVDDCAVLQAEVPMSRLQPASFVEALKNVCRYSSASGLEVSVLATNASVLDLYNEIEAAAVFTSGVAPTPEEDAFPDFNISANRLAD